MSVSKPRIGLIGVDLMGRGIAKNLRIHEFPLTGVNVKDLGWNSRGEKV
jgi:3-hydroxyisobutyrate dehydrogenase-like beta-hydroxyacid dehydrogenase